MVIIGLIIIIIGISTVLYIQHQKISSLKNSTHIFELLVSHITAGVMLQKISGKFDFVSSYTEVLTGTPKNEIKSIEEYLLLVHPDDRELFERSLKIPLLGESFQFRYRLIHASGIELWAETRLTPIEEKGEVSGILLVTFDVTAPVRHQKLVEERNKDLQDFSYIISHDLKSPIYTMKGMLGIIKEDFLSSFSQPAKEVFEHIDHAHQRLETLVRDILEYSRASAEMIQLESVSTSDVLNEVKLDFIQLLSEAGGEIIIPDSIPDVLAHKTKLYQVFANLVSNATKYRDKNKSLKIEIYFETKPSSKVITFFIKDNGLGISEEKKSTVFRPFQRAHSHTEGTGVGLSITQKLVQRMQGEITFESIEGEGSTFILKLMKS